MNPLACAVKRLSCSLSMDGPGFQLAWAWGMGTLLRR